MLKVMAHFLSAMFSALLGFALWFAPHLDWSRVKDESLFSTRGLVVLGMTAFCFLTNVFCMTMQPSKKDCVVLKVRKHKVK